MGIRHWHFGSFLDIAVGMSDSLSLYNYELPPELIAAHPLPERDTSRLLELDRRSGEITHKSFRDFPDLLRPNDLLVLNETKVVPARLVGRRTETGGHWEGLFLGLTDLGQWQLIGQTRGQAPGGRVDHLARQRTTSGNEPSAAASGTFPR